MTQRFTALLAVEGELTGDGRIIRPGALTWAEPPLPLSYVAQQSEGHDGAEVVGVIESIVRQGPNLLGEGYMLSETPLAYAVAEQIRAGVIKPSIDPDDVVMEIDEGDPEKVVAILMEGRIRGATLVSHQAILSASITLIDEPLPSLEDVAAFDPTELAGETPIGENFAVADGPLEAVEGALEQFTEASLPEQTGAMIALIPTAEDAARLALVGHLAPEDLHVTLAYLGEAEALDDRQRALIAARVNSLSRRSPIIGSIFGHGTFAPDADKVATYLLNVEDSVSEFRAGLLEGITAVMDLPEQHSPWVPHITAGNGITGDMLSELGEVTFDRLRVAYAGKVYDTTLEVPVTAPTATETVQAQLVASAGLNPPGTWFANPELAGPTPLTVDDGRVYGHLALWGTCHTGLAGCTTPPPSATGYDYFHTGEVTSAEGERIPTGRVTVGGGHAGPGLTFRAALAHYDDASVVAADVRAGEDEHGIWLAGAVRPGLEEATLHAFRASPPSGDWRRIKGSLELMSALCVNLPGFPVPRARSMVAAGVQVSLVAAGVMHGGHSSAAATPTSPDADAALVASVLGALEQRERMEAVASSLGRDRQTRIAALVAQVRA